MFSDRVSVRARRWRHSPAHHHHRVLLGSLHTTGRIVGKTPVIGGRLPTYGSVTRERAMKSLDLVVMPVEIAHDQNLWGAGASMHLHPMDCRISRRFLMDANVKQHIRKRKSSSKAIARAA